MTQIKAIAKHKHPCVITPFTRFCKYKNSLHWDDLLVMTFCKRKASSNQENLLCKMISVPGQFNFSDKQFPWFHVKEKFLTGPKLYRDKDFSFNFYFHWRRIERKNSSFRYKSKFLPKRKTFLSLKLTNKILRVNNTRSLVLCPAG